MQLPEHVIFLVHGIGGQSFTTLDATPKQAWADPVIEAFDAAWRQLPKLKNRERKQYVELVPITYDQVFHDYLKRFGSYAKGLEEGLGDALDDGTWKDILATAEGAAKDDAGFFWDSVFDVLLYRFGDGFARQVHEVIMEKIMATVRKYQDEPATAGVKFSMISHSLGTAAAHAALHQLGSDPIKGNDEFTLAGGAFHLHTYVSLANTSRLLWLQPGDVYAKTVLRPQNQGKAYVGTFLNVAHGADPIPRPLTFAPRDWGLNYELLPVQHIHEANVHGFAHYLKHPKVVGRLMRSLYSDRACTEVELAALTVEDVIAPDEARRKDIRRVRGEVIQELDQEFGTTNDVFVPTLRTLAGLIRPLLKALRALADVGAPV
jgi:hypothetical protein